MGRSLSPASLRPTRGLRQIVSVSEALRATTRWLPTQAGDDSAQTRTLIRTFSALGEHVRSVIPTVPLALAQTAVFTPVYGAPREVAAPFTWRPIAADATLHQPDPIGHQA